MHISDHNHPISDAGCDTMWTKTWNFNEREEHNFAFQPAVKQTWLKPKFK